MVCVGSTVHETQPTILIGLCHYYEITCENLLESLRENLRENLLESLFSIDAGVVG
jgi:hypothetical protein